MWSCIRCGETIEDKFDVCWNCGTTKDGTKDPQFRPVPEAAAGEAPPVTTQADPLACPRCDRALDYVGRKRFHEGANWGVFGELGELFVKREHFDVYVCPRCGRVEFFVDGIGEQYRQQ